MDDKAPSPVPGCLPEDQSLLEEGNNEPPLPTLQGSNAALAAWIEQRLRRDLVPIHEKLDKVLDQAFADGRRAAAPARSHRGSILSVAVPGRGHRESVLTLTGGRRTSMDDQRSVAAPARSRQGSILTFNGKRESELGQAVPTKSSGVEGKRFGAWSGSALKPSIVTEEKGEEKAISGLELVLSPQRYLRKSKTTMNLGSITKPEKLQKAHGSSKNFLDPFGPAVSTAVGVVESCLSSAAISEFSRGVSDEQVVQTSMSLAEALSVPEVDPEKPEEPLHRMLSIQRTVTEKDLARAEHLLNRFQTRRLTTTTAQKAWEFLDSPESSHAAKVFAALAPFFILMTVLVTLWQSHSDSLLYGVHAAVIETTIDSLFLLEAVLRFLCCPNRRAFFFDAFNIIDLLAAIPLAVRGATGFVLPTGEVSSVPHAILLCAVPIVRLLKILRRFEKFRLILNAFHLAAEALPVLLFILAMIALSFAMMIYLAEPRDNLNNIPTSLWLTLVTMFTVGYGDVTPTTSLGQQFTGALIIITALYMSIPIGIIGHAFTVTWNDRDKILLMQRTRDRLRQWGYSATDIPALFKISARSPDSGLDIRDFRSLLTRMQIGLTEERVLQLFRSFDVDHTGTVGDREFVRHLFPSAYEELYGRHSDPDDEELLEELDQDSEDQKEASCTESEEDSKT